MSLQSVENGLRTDTGRNWATPLWVAALSLFALGDVAITVVGIQYLGAVEAAPVAAGAIGEFGLLVLVPIKVAFVAATYVAYRLVPASVRIGIPFALAEFGAVVVGWNVAVLLVLAGVA